MKLAILGTDADIVQLLAAARSERFQIVWLGDVRPEDAAAVSVTAPGLIDQASNWELLLDRAIADAVLIGHGTVDDASRAERVKRLVTEGTPLLVVHPAFESVLTYYEIDMTRRESGAIVQHYNPLVAHPVTAAVASWIRDGHPKIGAIHQISCERRVTSPTRGEVLKHLARDVELLAAIAGDIRRVTAIGPKVDDSSYAALQIQIIAATAPSLRWSVNYMTSGGTEFEIGLHGEHGNAIIRILSGDGNQAPSWQIETNEQGTRHSEPVQAYDPARAAMSRLADSVNAQGSTTERGAGSTWDAATRAMEVVDAATLSLQKGRTIEVFQQQLTERLAFRGTMAAMGCGLLLMAFMVLVAVGIFGGIEGGQRRHLIESWSLVLLALLAFFLLLQAVPFLAGKKRRDQAEPPAPGPNTTRK